MKIAAIILTVACTLLIPVAGFMALFAGMAMNAPGSVKSVGKWLFVFLMMPAPIALLGAVVKAWASIVRHEYSAALWWLLPGLLPFALAMLLLHFNRLVAVGGFGGKKAPHRNKSNWLEK